MLSDWKNICTSEKALITSSKQTTPPVKIFSCLFLKSKFSAFWPNSVGLISKTIQPYLPQILHRACQRCELYKCPGDFFLFTWFWRNFAITVSYRCKTAISTLQFDKRSDNVLKCKSLEDYCKPILHSF